MKMNETSWYEVIRQHLSRYPEWLVEFCLYGIAGCFAGFICRNFGRFLLGFLVSFILILWFFSYLDIITFHTQTLKDILGLQTIQTIDDGIRIYAQWAREHWAACVGIIVGFIIGWKWSP